MQMQSEQTNNIGRRASRKEKRRARSLKIVKWMWMSFVGFGLLIAVLMLLIYNGVIGYMPPIEELEDPHDKLASVVYSSDGTEMGRYFQGSGNRVYTDYDSLSPYVLEALIATEDVRFQQHSGIDFYALGRATVKTLLMGDKSSGGASTITQQLAKQLYSQPEQNFFKRALQKPIEWMIAIKLERFYTKAEIINMYLNRFDFLNNAVGIKTAANVYFGKEPGGLSVTEAAMLIGMLKNPSYYNPLRYPERTISRRNTVFEQMVKAGYLTQAECDALSTEPLGLDYHKVDHKEGAAPYLREEIRRMLTAKKPVRPKRSDYKSQMAYAIALGNYNTDSTMWETDPIYGWIEKNPKPDGSYYNLYSDGLRIYTPLDLTMQQYAEQTVLNYMGGTIQPAFTAEKRGNKYGPYAGAPASQIRGLIDNAMRQTERWRVMAAAGASRSEIIKAFNTPVEMEIFTYVRSGGDIQPGTRTVTMTPKDSLMYMKSIMRCGLMSMDPVNGHVKAYVGGVDYQSFQYDMAGRGRRQIGSTAKPFLYTLAMENEFTPCSMMLCAQPVYNGWAPRSSSGGRAGSMVDLKWALTTSNNWISARLIHELGPAQLVAKERMFGITGYIEATLPLCLGTNDVSVREMVGAYSAFANKGMRVTPVLVTRITDSQGNPLYISSPHRIEVTAEDSYYKILSMLISVVRNGTGRGLGSYGIHAETGGKTGTTNSNSDMWFIGFTPQLVTGVWVGGDERYIHFNSMSLGQGARAALPIYGKYMQKVYADGKLPYSQDAKFNIPDDFVFCDGGAWRYGGSGGDDQEDGEVDTSDRLEGLF